MNIFEEDLENIAKALKGEAVVLEGKTILLTGAAGFLGVYLLGTLQYLNKFFFKKPCQIIAVDNYITGWRPSVAANDANVKFLEADVCYPLSIEGPVDYIIHAAGIASPVYYKKYPLETLEVAVLGTKNLLELAKSKKVASVLFFSSSEIYGDPDAKAIPTPETYKGNVSCTGPRSCYDESKRLGETICVIYHDTYGVPVKIVRPFNVYGPMSRPNDYRVIPMFLEQGLAGKSLPVHDTGNQTRTFCYITDAIIGFLKVFLSGKSGETYNVGTDQEEITMLELAKLTSGLLNNGAKIQLMDYPNNYPADEPRRRCPDLTKIKTQLGYRTTVSLQTGLQRTFNWYREKLNR